MIDAGTRRRLVELLELPANWDCEGAVPVSPANVLVAIEILADVMQPKTPAPSVVPTRCGGVQLEWHTGGLDVEIEIISPQRVMVMIGSWEMSVHENS